VTCEEGSDESCSRNIGHTDYFFDGVVFEIVGTVLFITTEESRILYAAGYAVVFVSTALLVSVTIRYHLRARKTDDIDDVCFN
jgi:hypothetical protein